MTNPGYVPAHQIPSRLVRLHGDPPDAAVGDLAEVVSDFSARVRSKDFPCIFARPALEQGDVVAGLARGARRDVMHQAGDMMRELADQIRANAETIGVLFLDVEGLESLADDCDFARDLLRHWHGTDRGTWPEEAPMDPAHPDWVFWFDDIGFFVNFSSPRHRRRRSRNMGPCFTVVAQAREIFDRPDRGGPQARRAIRRRLADYDAVAVHPALDRYGSEDNREVDQFFLGDDIDTHRLLDLAHLSEPTHQATSTTPNERRCPHVSE